MTYVIEEDWVYAAAAAAQQMPSFLRGSAENVRQLLNKNRTIYFIIYLFVFQHVTQPFHLQKMCD